MVFNFKNFQLFGEIISRLELRSKEKDPIMYELYVIFKDMAKLTESMQLTERYYSNAMNDSLQ